MRVALALILTASAAQAEPQPAVAELMHYMEGLPACLERVGDAAALEDCSGRFATLCMDSEEGGYSTIGMTFCMLAENEAWDRLLNTEYQRAMEGAREMDADEAELFPEFAARAEWLREAQRAWIAFRDAECALAYAKWGSGSMRQTAGAACLLDMTSERTIELKYLWDFMR